MVQKKKEEVDQRKEHHPYDKIFKENIGKLFIPLTEKQLGIRIEKTEEIKDKIQTTLEKEADFLRNITTKTGGNFILHLEFQTADETDMVYRMHEYYAILYKKFKIPIRQYVYYLGEKESSMPTSLKPSEVYRGFEMLSLHSIGYKRLLDSTIPEEIILALLADFGVEKAEVIIQKIITRLMQLKTDPIALEKYLRQMVLLARLRQNLNNTLQKQLSDMALTYDIEKDTLYQKGIEKGMEKGMEKGEYVKALKTAKKCLLRGMNEIEVADITDLSLLEVQQLTTQLKSEGTL